MPFIWIDVFNVNLLRLKLQTSLKQSWIYFLNGREKSWIALNFKCPCVCAPWGTYLCDLVHLLHEGGHGGWAAGVQQTLHVVDGLLVRQVQTELVLHLEVTWHGVKYGHMTWGQIRSHDMVSNMVTWHGVKYSHMTWCQIWSHDIVSYTVTWHGGQIQSHDMVSNTVTWHRVKYSHMTWCQIRSYDLGSNTVTWHGVKYSNMTWGQIRSHDMESNTVTVFL